MTGRTSLRVIFDDKHGQRNWSQTGFASRELHTNFAGLASILSDHGCRCASAMDSGFYDHLHPADLLVIPPATGVYNPKKQVWQRATGTLFLGEEICAILEFLHRGGRLLGFGYRFGDSFTQGNIGQVFAALGCLLNDDAVIDLEQLRQTNVLQSDFETRRDHIMAPWPISEYSRVRWRSMATFTILPESSVQPLVLSPGGRCISFNRIQKVISFQSLPIAVLGTKGRGRFALFGGPHAFETGKFGRLHEADNRKFIESVLSWLAADDHDLVDANNGMQRSTGTLWRQFCRIEAEGEGRPTVEFVEGLLRKTGTLKAISMPAWAA